MIYNVEETKEFLRALSSLTDDTEETQNISSDDGFFCEKCGWSDFNLAHGILKHAKYCPNCGKPVLKKRECS